MRFIPHRYGHVVYGVIQSGVTCAIAAAIASYPFLKDGTFLSHAAGAWFTGWIVMLPVVVLASPFIRRLSDSLLR